MRVVWVAALVALPFAIFSELIVDWKHIEFARRGVDGIKKAVKTRRLLTK